MIFRLSGRVDRLSRIVVLNFLGTGVTGVSPRKIAFGVGDNCDLGEAKAHEWTTQAIADLFGRQPDDRGGIYKLYRWQLRGLGAGFGIEPPRSIDYSGTPLEQDVDYSYPGGVARVDPSSLVSSQTAKSYTILPSSAGALQLARAGMIKLASESDIEDWRAKARLRYSPEVARKASSGTFYKVLKSVSIPTGLCGGEAHNFLLDRSVRLLGRPCHSTILGAEGQILWLDGSDQSTMSLDVHEP